MWAYCSTNSHLHSCPKNVKLDIHLIHLKLKSLSERIYQVICKCNLSNFDVSMPYYLPCWLIFSFYVFTTLVNVYSEVDFWNL